MRCPNCSNEISLEETFCGQCGTPVILSAKPVDRANYQGLLSSGYYSVNSPSSETHRSGSQQQNGFHQYPTQAMSIFPSYQVQSYPQQNFGSPSIPVNYSGTGQYATQMQPFQSGNNTGTTYAPTQTFPSGQGYGMPPGFTPPPPQKRSNLALIIISICIILALITIFAFGATYLLRNRTDNKTQLSHQNATATSIPTPTTVPGPSPTATPSSTPSPTPTPTPAPDAGFILCDSTCTSNGFIVEYPGSWVQNPTHDSTIIQCANPSQSDEFTTFKTPGITSMNAGQLVNSDLNNFSSQPGYNAPTPTPSSNATIGGENWSFQIAYYQLNSQTVRIEVYATIHQGKAYVIELQALDSDFDAANTQFFERMLVRFQFQ